MPEISKHSNRLIRVRPRVPDSERKRVAKACQRCRFRKSRCIIAQRTSSHRLVCQRCFKAGVHCVFEDPREEDVDARRRMISESRIDARQSYAGAQGNGRRPSLEGGGAAAAAESHRSPESARLVVNNPHQTHYVGEVSNGTFLAQVQDAVVAESPVDVAEDVDPHYPARPSEAIVVDVNLLQAALQGLPPKSVADFLVQVFFHTVEANYYYMDRLEFRARLDRLYADPSSGPLDPSFLCLVLIVLAMGSQFAELQGPLVRTTAREVSENGPGMVFYLKAKLLLSDVVTQCSLEGIQACFLMGLFLLPTNISDLSYVYHGMAMKMAISAGLHRKIADTNLQPRVLHVRNRLWWSLYTSERRLTIILDRPESIREDDIDAPLPEFSPELDLPESEDNTAHLQASIALTQIFNKVVRLGKTVGFDHDAGKESAVAHLRRSLDEWAEALPWRLRLDNLSPDMKSFRGAVHLHMNWNQIIIYMGRRALLRHVQRHLSRRHRHARDSSSVPNQEDAGSSPSAAATTCEATLIRECVAAAIRIIQLVNYLWETGKLARFSFTDLNCCSTATLIVMVHEIAQQHPLYSSSVETAMQAMSHMATGCRNAKEGLRLIRHLQRVITALKSEMAHDERGTDGQMHGYREWERWMALRDDNAASSSVAATPSVRPTAGEARMKQGEYMVGEDFHGASSASVDSGLMPVSSLEEMSGTVGTEQSVFMGPWTDNLDSLGLSGFEDFTFPSF